MTHPYERLYFLAELKMQLDDIGLYSGDEKIPQLVNL